MRPAAAIILACTVVCTLAGCGNGVISTESARSALESAGFHRRVVFRGLGLEDPTFDEIVLRGNRPSGSQAPFFSPLRLVRFHSDTEAKRAFRVDGRDYSLYSRAGVKAFVAYRQRDSKPCPGCRVALPRGFEVRKIFSFRICNVILFSYNARLDARLTAKVNRAAAALRAKCH